MNIKFKWQLINKSMSKYHFRLVTFQRFLKLPRNAPFKLRICSSNFSISASFWVPALTKPLDAFWCHSLEKEMATHSSILAWRIPWTEDLDRLQSMGWQRVGHDWATSLSFFFFFYFFYFYTLQNCISFAKYHQVLCYSGWVRKSKATLSISNRESLILVA